MAEQRVYHWKHGWIPLDHYAALSKAKGNDSLAARYVKEHNIAPKESRTRNEVERDLRNTMPAGYDVRYHMPGRNEIGRQAGWQVKAPGRPAMTFATENEVHAYVKDRVERDAALKAAPPKPVEPVKAPAAKQDLAPSKGTASQRQVDYIMKLLDRRRRSGEGGGFMTGPTHRAGVASMSSTEASAYIRSLTGDY